MAFITPSGLPLGTQYDNHKHEVIPFASFGSGDIYLMDTRNVVRAAIETGTNARVTIGSTGITFVGTVATPVRLHLWKKSKL